ncbi:DUF4234 domain-containing protein [Flavobacterium sp.]|jgi:hypothetical protein|uniref:DUF4234 domain-containing protein n=1 Tax=Flavobacterium sp. TaxID=239 RepID=UPI002A818F8F|nr:DUF4234 domain-containing protein [Flavobacterium sp.]
METTKTNEDWNQPQSNIPNFKVDPIVVLILGIITCGLYLIYWNVKMAEVLNAVNNKEVISPTIAIVTGCCGLNLFFYWLVGRDALPKVYQLTGQPNKDDSTLLLVLGLFFPMISAMIVQSEVNKLYN